MAKDDTKSKTPERLPGAEGECISREQQEIVEWYRKVKFKKNLLGGVDEVQMWKKLEELYGLYANAIRAERARYDALLESNLALSGAPRQLSQRESQERGGEALASPSGRGVTEGDGEGEPRGEGGCT